LEIVSTSSECGLAVQAGGPQGKMSGLSATNEGSR